MNYTALYILDTTAELIELTHQLGVWTRKYVVPAGVAVYVAVAIAIEYFVAMWRKPNRAQMIEALCLAYHEIEEADPTGEPTTDFRDWLLTLSDDQLIYEYSGLEG